MDMIDRKKAIMMASPHIETVSGSIASFKTDMGINLKECKLHFLPVQSGSGNPSPSNVRSITGWTGITVTHCGKNILDFEALLQYWNSGNTKIGDNSYNVRSTGIGYQQPFEFFKNDTTISMSGSVTDLQDAGRWRFELLNESGTRVGMLGTTSGNSSGMYQVPNVSGNKYRLNFGTAGNGATFENIQVELGAECTSFEPYKGVEIPISWQSEVGTLYGGYVDLVSGELVAEYGYIDLGSIEWDITSSANRARSTLLVNEIKRPVDMYTVPDVVCEKYTPIHQYVSLNNYKTSICVSIAGILILYYDGENLPSGAMAYKLATPTTYQLTPQQIKTFIGTNNIWTDYGDVEVQFWRH